MKLLFLGLLLSVQTFCHDHHEHHHGHHHGHHHEHHHGHGHAHGNMGEEPKFKYSKKANVKVEDEGPDFPASQRGHGHSHEPHHHSHESHGHSHEAHGHSHEGHGHSHETHSHSHETHGHTEGKSKTFTPPVKKAVSWIEPLLATAAISAAPFLILFVVPLNNNSPENQPFLKILLAFASGGLLGDAFLHLIPHAISPHSHDGSHSHDHSHSHSHHHQGESHEDAHDHTGDMLVGLWVLAGIILFLVVEKLVRHIKGGHGHSHGHSHKTEIKKEDGKEKKKVKKEKDSDNENDDEDHQQGKFSCIS